MAGVGVQVHIDTRGLQKLGDPEMIKRAEAAIVQAALAVVGAEARAQTPGGKTKYLGIFHDRNNNVGVVMAKFPLLFRITGAVPHEIGVRVGGRRGRPVKLRRFKTESGTIVTRQRGNFQALRFNLGGFEYFRRNVRHPGLRGDPFLKRAADYAEDRAAMAADRALQGALDAAQRS